MKQTFLALLAPLALMIFLASCANGQLGSTNQGDSTFNDPPEFFAQRLTCCPWLSRQPVSWRSLSRQW